ncbi:monovalent cation/H+ antiporter complex subunit F [Arthrobacter sp. UM1]|uniref:monovalent cation/H+ antiporter complex subunit F n=1 Tax=Arthrobacter sp. UM1 TaxID=2766776 RepID=UPI001CF67830|nr:monovalent cation/H+ antiporter complex subunit F [Arthrobacter sp. UM1]MCB4208458.1 cation:proton antiporter [Arthrobacter sp. UM1]
MSFLEICTVIAGALLGVASLVTIVRLQKGPLLLDRVIAVDVLVTAFSGALAVYMVSTKSVDHLTLLIVLSLVAWVSSLSFAIFLAARKEGQGS